jgi:succinate dehydrogenase/fumarate reductase flavoprotein subunit
MKTLETDLLIVGCGGAGLTDSMRLAQLGVDAQLVSALPEGSAEGAPAASCAAGPLAASERATIDRDDALARFAKES